jgi:hypothetical protein
MAGDAGEELSEGVNSQPIDKPNGRRIPYGPVFQGSPWFSPPAYCYIAVQERTQLELPGGGSPLNLHFKLYDRWM